MMATVSESGPRRRMTCALARRRPVSLARLSKASKDDARF